ncbi:hypothetical protein QQP08_023930 [Theobroma cacao]|nr:hypothetical protein QQP08_023930 [Theobroma cacao]
MLDWNKNTYIVRSWEVECKKTDGEEKKSKRPPRALYDFNRHAHIRRNLRYYILLETRQVTKLNENRKKDYEDN